MRRIGARHVPRVMDEMHAPVRHHAPLCPLPAAAQRQSNGALHHALQDGRRDRKSTRLNSSHLVTSYAVFCLKKKKNNDSMYIPALVLVNQALPTYTPQKQHYPTWH